MGYTFGMKTAISIPDDVFRAADELARKLGTSRSQLYARAVREYVARHTEDAITAALDSVYGREEPQDEFVEKAARAVLERTEW